MIFDYQSPTFWYPNTIGTECLLLPAVQLHKTAILMELRMVHD